MLLQQVILPSDFYIYRYLQGMVGLLEKNFFIGIIREQVHFEFNLLLVFIEILVDFEKVD